MVADRHVGAHIDDPTAKPFVSSVPCEIAMPCEVYRQWLDGNRQRRDVQFLKCRHSADQVKLSCEDQV